MSKTTENFPKLKMINSEEEIESDYKIINSSNLFLWRYLR